MALFPNDLEYKSIKAIPEKNSRESKMAGGYVSSAKKYTKTRYTYELALSDLETEKADNLIEFYKSVETYSSFIWIHPTKQTNHEVRFVKPLSWIETTLNKEDMTFESFELVEI